MVFQNKDKFSLEVNRSLTSDSFSLTEEVNLELTSKKPKIQTLKNHLEATDDLQQALHHDASRIRDDTIGPYVYYRALVELSNICNNDCFYCGIRHSNPEPNRYNITPQQIARITDDSHKKGFRSIVLQSGEREDERFIEQITTTLELIKKQHPDIHVTLSCGEQEKDTYRRWRQAGAHRYLLRIETTNENLYRKYHPPTMDYKRRYQCLKDLEELDYQTGTGILIGLPEQTSTDLARDLLEMKKLDIDMVGMGPYVHHPQTPLGRGHPELATHQNNLKRFNLALNMIALLRHLMPSVNIASTTALMALHPKGNRLGLLAGANVLMPQITPLDYRYNYQLYDGKPTLDLATDVQLQNIDKMIRDIGLTPQMNTPGDPLHYHQKRRG